MRHYPPRTPRHPAGHWTTNRDRTTQARFRQAVANNAGHRCQHVNAISGTRCPATNELQAHHLQPGNDDPATGVLLCRPHHRLVDQHAR